MGKIFDELRRIEYNIFATSLLFSYIDDRPPRLSAAVLQPE